MWRESEYFLNPLYMLLIQQSLFFYDLKVHETSKCSSACFISLFFSSKNKQHVPKKIALRLYMCTQCFFFLHIIKEREEKKPSQILSQIWYTTYLWHSRKDNLVYSGSLVFLFHLVLLPPPGISWANTYLKHRIHQNKKHTQTEDWKWTTIYTTSSG